MKYLIEHLEPQISDWVLLEYNNISKILGKNNLIFTNVKNEQDRKLLNSLGTIYKESVSELDFLNQDNSLILDPEAEHTLEPSDKKFEYLIFGGILGDYPMKKRTKIELSSKLPFQKRNLGDKQMSTDTAVLVSKKIIEGNRLQHMHFADTIEIEINQGESIILPYRYYMEEDIVFVTPGLINLLKEKDAL